MTAEEKKAHIADMQSQLKIKLLDDKIILRSLTQKTAGGIVIPGMLVAYTMYEVVAVGPGHYDKRTATVHPLEVAPGDRVLVNYGSCKEIEAKTIVVDGNEEKLYLCDTAEECIIVLDDDEGIG